MNVLKIWMDILTPKQVLFFEPMIRVLEREEGHVVMCTSRTYGEASKLAEIRGLKLVYVGKHGGGRKSDKLDASIDRMMRLSKKIQRFSPDLVISFCSPEAARVAFGLGIRHIAFYDGPHADAIVRLTVPLLQKLLTPRVIAKGLFSRYGISKDNIIQYNAIDAGITIRRQASQGGLLPFKDAGKANILIRTVEEEASYAKPLRQDRSDIAVRITEEIVDRYGEQNIVVLCRYHAQARRLRKAIGKKAKVIRMSFDGKYLLENTDIFIGSGGTMTAESALMGVPTISYDAIPNVVEEYLVKRRLVKRLTAPRMIAGYVGKIITPSGGRLVAEQKKKAKAITGRMEDPLEVLLDTIKKP